MPRQRAKRVTYYGHTFDSNVEAMRYLQLRSELEAGDISDLVVHPCYELQPAMTRRVNGKRTKIRAVTYTADFEYMRDGRLVVEDVKGRARGGKAFIQEAARLRHKWFQGQFPDVDFRIVVM